MRTWSVDSLSKRSCQVEWGWWEGVDPKEARATEDEELETTGPCFSLPMGVTFKIGVVGIKLVVSPLSLGVSVCGRYSANTSSDVSSSKNV